MAVNLSDESQLVKWNENAHNQRGDMICCILLTNMIFFVFICICNSDLIILYPLHDLLYYDNNQRVFLLELIIFIMSIIIGFINQTPHWRLKQWATTYFVTSIVFLIGLPYSIPIWIAVFIPKYTVFDSKMYQRLNIFQATNDEEIKLLNLISMHHHLSKYCRRNRNDLQPMIDYEDDNFHKKYPYNLLIFYVRIDEYLKKQIISIFDEHSVDLRNIYHHIRYIHIKAYMINVIIIFLNLILHWISFIKLIFFREITHDKKYGMHWLFFMKIFVDIVIVVIGIICLLIDSRWRCILYRKSFFNHLHCLSLYEWYLGHATTHNHIQHDVKIFYNNWKDIYEFNVVTKIIYHKFGAVSWIINGYLFDKQKLNRQKTALLL